MTFKQKTYNRCIVLVQSKISSLRKSLTELEEGSENDSKSSAGDKHETSRAMMQLEQEKISRQLDEFLSQKTTLQKIDSAITSPQITKGSLVKTNKGYLYVSIALGKVNVGG